MAQLPTDFRRNNYGQRHECPFFLWGRSCKGCECEGLSQRPVGWAGTEGGKGSWRVVVVVAGLGVEGAGRFIERTVRESRSPPRAVSL